MVGDVLFRLGLRLVAMGWQVWVSWLVGVGLFKVELGLVVIE